MIEEKNPAKTDILEERIIHLRELFETHHAYVKEALELQAKEYERRLDILNHQAEQIVEMKNTFVFQESFNEYRKAIEVGARLMNDIMNGLTTFQATIRQDVAVLMESKRNTENELIKIRDTELAPIKSWKSSLDGKWAIIAFLLTIAMFLLNYLRK